MISKYPQISEFNNEKDFNENIILNEIIISKEKESIKQNKPIIDENLKLLKDLLKIPKGNKSIEEMNLLYKHLKEYKFFKIGKETYGKNTLISLIDSCEFFEIEKDEIMINLGETVKSAFILLNGEIKICSHNPLLKYTEDEQGTGEENVRKIDQNYNNNFFGNQFEKLINDNNLIAKKVKQTKRFNLEDEWFVPIGDIFGDKCLIERKIWYFIIIKKDIFYLICFKKINLLRNCIFVNFNLSK